MKILVEITHPADVHFFRNAIAEFERRGHQVAVTARQKDVAIQLLTNYKIPFTKLSDMGIGRAGLLRELLARDARLWNFCRSFKPDVLTGLVGVYAAHVGFLLRRPVVVWDDTEHAKLSLMLTVPFANVICTPSCYEKSLGKKQRRYPGFHQLAYLHPRRFTPDINVVRSLSINPDEKYCIIRFVSWQAHHDVGQHGIVDQSKYEFVRELSKFAKPYITSEKPLGPELERYRLDVPVHLVHHVLAFAGLYVGEGATMASEAACLAVPTVYTNTLKLGYINMLEGFGLIKQTTDVAEALRLCTGWLTDPMSKRKALLAREKMLSGKIDVTDYIVQTIEEAAK
jgi:predicted glycosyltransferase